MSYRKYDNIYVIGCSHTAGGGLYDFYIQDFYKEKGIIYNSEREVNFPKLVAQNFNLNLIDESKCGTGSPYQVRKTYEYINKVGIEAAQKTLFIFQFNWSHGRQDVYVRDIDDYVVANFHYLNHGEDFEYFNVVDNHSRTESKIDKIIKGYFAEGKTEKKGRVIKENVNVRGISKKVQTLSETKRQEESARNFVKNNPSATLIGKSSKNNLLFENNGKTVKVTTNGRIL